MSTLVDSLDDEEGNTFMEWQQQLLSEIHDLVVDDSIHSAWNAGLCRWCERERLALVAHNQKVQEQFEAGVNSSEIDCYLSLLDRDPADNLDKLALLAGFFNAHSTRRRFKVHEDSGKELGGSVGAFLSLVVQFRNTNIEEYAVELRHAMAVAAKLSESRESSAKTALVPPSGKPLVGWPQILSALNLKKTNTQNLRHFAKAVDGCPIKFGSKGKRPTVIDVDLLQWWNEKVLPAVQHSEAVRQDEAATVASTYEHGREGVVVPGIDGHIQRSKKVK